MLHTAVSTPPNLLECAMLAHTQQIQISSSELVEMLADGLTRIDYQDLHICVDAAGQIAWVNAWRNPALIHDPRWIAKIDLRRFGMHRDEEYVYPGNKSYQAWAIADAYVNDPYLKMEQLFGHSAVFLPDETIAVLALVD